MSRGNTYSIPRDANRIPLLAAASTSDGITPVILEADPSTHALVVSSSGGGGGGTQYAELATTSPGTGTLTLGRYKSSAPTLTDGQMYGLQLDSSGNLKVTGSLSVGGTTDNSTYTAGSSTGTPSFGFYHSTLDAVTDGRAAAIAITANRAEHVNLRKSDGTEIAPALDATLTGGNMQVQGNVAGAGADSGNPIKVGGRYNTTRPTYTNGQRTDLQSDTRGSFGVNLFTQDTGQSIIGLADNADGVAVSSLARALDVINRNTIYNGTAWDRIISANGASNTTGTGLLGAGVLGFDGTNYQRIGADAAKNMRVSQYADTATLTNVAASASSVNLLAANTAAKSRLIFNDSSAILYIKFGATASTSSYTMQIPSNTGYEFPLPNYTGTVDGIWGSATGNARITEII